ncbi:hypothetical protein [Lacticaseibacillus sp. N501-2]|uniref:hypothetical protein n=1 Tax=Lacticaseibacillus salsurae TaxID=3367729 RepID=UPI0038B3A73B
MYTLRRPQFLPGFLAVCLAIGVMANLFSPKEPITGFIVVIGAALVLLSAYWLAPKLNALPTSQVTHWLTAAGGLMVLGQLAVLKWLPQTVYHDPYRVLSQADQMAAGHNIWAITYFWRYPNNVALTYLMSLWLRLTNHFGLATNTSIHFLSLIVLDGLIALLLLTIRRFSHRNAPVIGVAGLMMLTPFAYTYFLQVFYSDLPAMLCLLAVFALINAWPHGNSISHWFMGLGLIVLAALGQLLKPNLIVLLPAMLIVGGILAAHKQLTWRKVLPWVLIMVGFGLSMPAKTAIDQASNFHADPQFQLPATSWVVMGLNHKSAGMYAVKDVKQAIKIGNQQQVQTHDLKLISKRVHQLGVVGLFKLWVVKLGILQRVGGIGHWYNGGFRAAPAWVQLHAGFWSALTTISEAIVTVALMVTLIIRLWTWQPDFTNPTDAVVLLAITTTLGLFAFHTLLWEVESRYGQIVLPLLGLSLAGIKPANAHFVSRRHQIAVPAVLTSLMVVAIGGASLISHWYPQTEVVAAQRSQLSNQYHAAPHHIHPDTTLKQIITLNGAANYLSVQVHKGAVVDATLTNAAGKRYAMTQAGPVYHLHHRLAPGTYTLSVTNQTHTAQAVDVVQTYHYQLAAHPLVINGVKHPHASFIYTCLKK